MGRRRANAILIAALESLDPSLIDDDYIYDNRQIGLRGGVTAAEIRRAVHEVAEIVGGDLSAGETVRNGEGSATAEVADLLPPDLARPTLEARLADPESALTVLSQPIVTGS